MENGILKIVSLHINKKFIYDVLTKEILSGEYNRIVLDSVTPLVDMPIFVEKTEFLESMDLISSDDFSSTVMIPKNRMHLYYIMNLLDTVHCTSLVTSELPYGSFSLSRDGISEFLVDGVILLNFDPIMDRRKISVMKMRNTHHSLKPRDIKIEEDGIKLL